MSLIISYTTMVRGVSLDGHRLEAAQLVAELQMEQADRNGGNDAVPVLAEQWKTELFRYGILNAKGSNPRQAYRRLRDWLVAEGAIGTDHKAGTVWFIGSMITIKKQAAGTGENP